MSARSHYFGHEEKARIEVIPMIDIMMFLLVFFILATLKMIQSAGITLDLPKAATAQQIETTKVTIGVSKDGTITLDAQAIEREPLIAHLRGLLADKKVDVVIAGDKLTPYDNIVRVMDIVREAGVVAIALATANN
ncbi:MAG: biopolymer transporter ExbD [Burkholderiaceae bacterium]